MTRIVLLFAVLFTVVSAHSAGAVRITSPASGSTLLVDSTVTIRWEGANGAAVALWYSTDGRQTWELIARDIRTGEYTWTVPDLPSLSIDFRIESLIGASPIPLRVFRDAHAGEIRTATFSRDGRLMLSAGKDGFVKVHNLATGEVDSAFLPNGGEIYAAKFAASTDTVFANQSDGIYRWDRVRGVIELMDIDTPPDIPMNFRTLDVYPDRHLLVTGGSHIIVWDYRKRNALATIPTSLSYTASFSHDGSRIVYAGDNGTVHEWEWETEVPEQVYRQHGTGNLNLVVWSCAFAPGDTMIASGGVDATVRLWKKSTGSATLKQCSHNSHVRSVAWSPDARRVLSGSLDSTIRQWDAAEGGQIGDSLNHGGQVIAIAYSPTGDTILSAGRDGAIIFWKSGFSEEGRDTVSYALGRECVLEIPHITGNVGKGVYVPLVWRNRAGIPEFMAAEGTALIELPNLLLETVSGGNTIERRRGTTRDTVLLPVRPGIPGDTVAVIAARVLLGVPVRQDIRILSVEWQPGVRLVPTTVDGSITVQDTCGLLTLRAVDFAGNRVLSISPNPVVESAFATFELAVDEPPHIAVYDARGVEVGVVQQVPSRAGTHTVRLPVEHLTTGEYFVRLHTGGRQYSAKFTVVR